jgi:hypothetical protein
MLITQRLRGLLWPGTRNHLITASLLPLSNGQSMSAILATWEAAFGRIMDQGQPQKIVLETSSLK